MTSRQQERWPLWVELMLLGITVILTNRHGHSYQSPTTNSVSANEGAFEQRPSQEPQALQNARSDEPGRGREAAAPSEIPVRGWKDILWRTYNQIGEDRLLAVGAGAVFYLLLAMFPAITAFVSSYGLLADTGTIAENLAALSNVIPQGGLAIIQEQVVRLTQTSNTALGFGFFSVLHWRCGARMQA